MNVVGMIPCEADGGAYNGSSHQYYCNQAGTLAVGDLVIASGTADSTGMYRGVNKMVAGSGDPIGVVKGFATNADSNLPVGQLYKKSADTAYPIVADDPNLHMKAVCSNGTLAIADVNLNVDIADAGVNTVTGLSGMSIDVGTKNTTATLPLRIRNVSPVVGNTIGAACEVIVSFNMHAHGLSRTAV